METDNEWFIERANHKLKQYLEINGIQYLEIDKIYKNSNGLYNNENKEILSTIFLPFTNLIKNHRYGFGVGIHKNTFDNLYFLCKKNNVEDIFIIEEYSKLSYYLDNHSTKESKLSVSNIIQTYLSSNEYSVYSSDIINLDNLIQTYLKNETVL